MTTHEMLLAAYHMLDAALAAIDYADDEGIEALDVLFVVLAGSEA